MLDMRFLLY